MIIEEYGLRLVRLKEEDIELVRRWRNSEKINRHMAYKEHITVEMQKKWFASIDNFSNFFFIVQSGQSKIGLVNLKSVSLDNHHAEVGIFIWDDKYLGSGKPMLSLLILMNFGYYFLGLHHLCGLVLKSNSNAINSYKRVGAVITEEANQIQIVVKATREAFESNIPLMERTVLRSHTKDTTASMVLESADNKLTQHILDLYERLPLNFKKRYTIVQGN